MDFSTIMQVECRKSSPKEKFVVKKIGLVRDEVERSLRTSWSLSQRDGHVNLKLERATSEKRQGVYQIPISTFNNN